MLQLSLSIPFSEKCESKFPPGELRAGSTTLTIINTPAIPIIRLCIVYALHYHSDSSTHLQMYGCYKTFEITFSIPQISVLKKENIAADVDSEDSLSKVECSSHWNNWTAKYAFINLPHGSIPGMTERWLF